MTYKKLYVIAGCNGAGKTTASFTILPEILDCKEFINADEIARGISPFQPEKVSFEAGRIMLNRINELLDRSESFAFETTLSGRAYLRHIARWRGAGYRGPDAPSNPTQTAVPERCPSPFTVAPDPHRRRHRSRAAPGRHRGARDPGAGRLLDAGVGDAAR